MTPADAPENRGGGSGTLDLEHREIVDWVVDLRRAAEGTTQDGKPHAWTNERREGFRRLVARLGDHFAREEALDGLYSRLLGRRPDLGTEIGLLQDQHRIFRTWGRDLLGEAERDSPDTLGIAEGLRAFLDLLGRHETRERELEAEVLTGRPPDGE